jgi:hypothetical protein
MRKRQDNFRPEVVDEQIEQLLPTENPAPVSRMVQNLQGLYLQRDTPEQERRSLDAIWSRLTDHLSAENQTMPSPSASDLLHLLSREELQTSPVHQHQASLEAQSEQVGYAAPSQGGMLTLPERPVLRQSSKRNPRRTLALSALAALVLLSIVSWVLVVRLNVEDHSHSGSGPGTPVPTIPATPAPQSLRVQAHQLLNQFHQEVTTWGKTHQYQDTWDGKSYELDYAYDQQGIGAVLDRLVDQAKSSADYQEAIDQIQNELTNLSAMESNATDETLWKQVHRTDSSLLNHYKLNTGVVVVVSLLEQSMRIYQDGQLINAFQITSGTYETPSLPGTWQIIQRQANVVIKSPYPKGSPQWYPPMPVQYLLTYHTGGYTILDSWWRADYGRGTNFPHRDTGGNPQANNASLGSVDLPSGSMAWLYKHVQLNTPVVIY